MAGDAELKLKIIEGTITWTVYPVILHNLKPAIYPLQNDSHEKSTATAVFNTMMMVNEIVHQAIRW